MTLWRLFDAGRVRRWHTNPDLSWTEDYLDGHHGRVARLLLYLHPRPHVALLRAALTHDDGEWAVGDLAQPFKARLRREAPSMLDYLELVEDNAADDLWEDAVAGPADREGAQADDIAWLRFCDRLDAWMWAARWAPQAVRQHPSWVADRQRLIAAAIDLGIPDRITAVIRGDGMTKAAAPEIRS